MPRKNYAKGFAPRIAQLILLFAAIDEYLHQEQLVHASHWHPSKFALFQVYFESYFDKYLFFFFFKKILFNLEMDFHIYLIAKNRY